MTIGELKTTKTPTRKAWGIALAGICAFAMTLVATAGFREAEAGYRTVPSSDCHPATDNIGTTVNNSGVLSNSGASAVNIYCPLVSDSIVSRSNATTVTVYGQEGTNGANSRACACTLNPVTCWCDTASNWTNNLGGDNGRLATLATGAWGTVPEQKFGYMLHSLTQNSSLAGVNLYTP